MEWLSHVRRHAIEDGYQFRRALAELHLGDFVLLTGSAGDSPRGYWLAAEEVAKVHAIPQIARAAAERLSGGIDIWQIYGLTAG